MRIIYNGIDLKVIDLVAASCQPVYDDSGVDILYCAYTFSVTGMVNGLANVNQFENGHYLGPAISLKIDSENTLPVSQFTLQKEYSPPEYPIRGSDPTNTGVDSLGNTIITGASAKDNTNPILTEQLLTKPSSRVNVEIVQTLNSPALTIQILNAKLNEPRAQLWVFDGNGAADELIVQSHTNSQVCDCKNGPIPIATNIVKAFGDGATFFVNFQVQTFVNTRIYPNGTGPEFLLSNRFSTTHSINEDSLMAITVNGVAHGRTDLMYEQGKNLDSLRKSLFLPVPAGFIRKNMTVTGSADGTTVNYSYTDMQQPVNFVAGRYINATQIEAVHRQSIECANLNVGGMIDSYDRYQDIKNNRAWREEMKRKAEHAAEMKGLDKKIASHKASYWEKKDASIKPRTGSSKKPPTSSKMPPPPLKSP
jgi:hypothetical protein